MRTRRKSLAVVLALLATLVASAALASPAAGLYQPTVPVSAFSRPAFWFDPSRLQISTEVSMGTGFSGGSSGLQVTRLSYRIGEPLSMSVSVGNAFGAGTRGGTGMFLEGLDLQYRPMPSMLVQFRYNDLRSPYQLARYYDYWR
jgi:hypothetical protein